MTHSHKIVHSSQHEGASIFVGLARGVAAAFGSPYILALVLVWVVGWVGFDIYSAMHFDQNFALLLALTSIPQLPLGIAILVVGNVSQRTQDAIAAQQGVTLQKIHDLAEQGTKQNEEIMAKLGNSANFTWSAVGGAQAGHPTGQRGSAVVGGPGPVVAPEGPTPGAIS